MIKDKNSAEWIVVKQHCERRLTELRDENDGDIDEIRTAKIRGMIAFAKEILDLESKDRKLDVREVSYIS